MRIFAWLGMAFTVIVLVAGCSSTSPVLMQLPAEAGGSAEFPISVGVLKATKVGDQKLTNMKTYGMLGLYQFGARMPRREEIDFLSRAISEYLRDSKTFTYVYDQPFNRDDVDLIIKTELEKFDMNNSVYGTVMQNVGFIPTIGFIIQLSQLVGVPQETFHFDYRFTMKVETPSGQELAAYTFEGSDWDTADLYDQPFANWLWYDSLFQKMFFQAMEDFKGKFRQDKEIIMAAIPN